MARIATVTWRGENVHPDCYYNAASGGFSRHLSQATPTGFDNPVVETTSYLGVNLTLSPALTEGRVGVRFKNINPSSENVSRFMALYEDTTTRVTLLRDPGSWGRRLYTDNPATVYEPTYLNMEISSDYGHSHVAEIYWKCDGASSIVRVYHNGILVIEHNPCNIGTAGINKVFLGGYSGGTFALVNQYEWLIVEDANTELCWQKFSRLKPNGVGNTTQLTPKPSGTNYQLVDEAVADAADYNLADAANEKDTYACENSPSDVGSVVAVKVCGVAAQQAEGALQAKSVVRTGSTDYDGDAKTIENASNMFIHRWPTNPNTSAAWQTSEIDAMEIGMKAVSP